MNRRLFVAALVFLVACSIALADPAVESAQQKLKDQGFYYGEINGQKNADTTAAIRRYQIRNGLQITGDLNDETIKALHSAPASTPAPAAPAFSPTRPTQTPVPQEQQQPDTSDLRDDQSGQEQA